MATNGILNGDESYINGTTHVDGKKEVNGTNKRPIRIAGCSGGMLWSRSSSQGH